MERKVRTVGPAALAGDELVRAYADLKRQYDNLVVRNVAGVFRSTLQGRFLECNDAMARMLGYSGREELMVVHTAELYFTDLERKRFIADLERSGTLTNYALTLRHKNGEPVHVLENVFMGKEGDDEVTIEGTMIDMSAFRKAQAGEERLENERMRATMAEEVNEVLRHEIDRHKRTQEELSRSKTFARSLVNSSLDCIIAVDRSALITEFNPAAALKFGYEPGEVFGQPARMLYATEEEHQRVLSELDTHGLFTGEVNNVDREGRRFTSFLAASRLYDDTGRLLGSMGVSRDITKAKEDREKLDHETAKLKALFESGDHMFWTVDRDLALTSFNQGYSDMILKLHGTRPEVRTDVSKPRRMFASEEYHGFWARKYADALAGRTLRFETEVKARDGSIVCNEIFLSPVIGADGEVDEVFGIAHEVTEQVMAERTVRDQAARLKAIFENSANVMIWTLDRQFRITAFNEHFEHSNMRGLGIQYKVGDPFVDDMRKRVAKGRWHEVLEYYEAALKGEPQHFEVELDNGKGRMLWVENFLNPIVVDGEVREISCLAHGITDRKDAQRKMQENLHEKEVLLKEVHHRVKNNLQIISSILNLQSTYVGGDKRMLELLRDSQDRVRSMSFIHESLYQTKNFSSIDLGGYIDSLSRNLMHSYSLSGKVRLNISVQKVELGLDQAIPCGLILNELLSNALKHGFPDGAEGAIDIKVALEGRQVRISVSDNGVGLPVDFHEEHSANLGLQLVQTLTGQIDGLIERKPGKGAQWLLTFDRSSVNANHRIEKP